MGVVKDNACDSKSSGLDGQSAVYGIMEPYLAQGNDALGTLDVSAFGSSFNAGSFITAVEMETGLSEGHSQQLYSGISTSCLLLIIGVLCWKWNHSRCPARFF